jgi:hypothetical protein
VGFFAQTWKGRADFSPASGPLTRSGSCRVAAEVRAWRNTWPGALADNVEVDGSGTVPAIPILRFDRLPIRRQLETSANSAPAQQPPHRAPAPSPYVQGNALVDLASGARSRGSHPGRCLKQGGRESALRGIASCTRP